MKTTRITSKNFKKSVKHFNIFELPGSAYYLFHGLSFRKLLQSYSGCYYYSFTGSESNRHVREFQVF